MRITNLTSGFQIKPSQAQNRIEQCISCWVVEGRTIRDLSLSERVNARSEQVKLNQGLFYTVEVTEKDGSTKLVEKPYLAELHGLKVENLPHLYEERQLAQEANKFCQECAA
jgi:hypothetical protein